MSAPPPFAARVVQGMGRRGVTLRRFCRAVGLDPSFFSKVLSGKRSPPSEEAVLRRIAEVLGLDPAELIVAAGRIPQEWEALWEDPQLFRDIHFLATRAGLSRQRPKPSRGAPPARAGQAPLAEELL